MSQPNIEDIYPLTPAQEGLLFHCVAEPGTGLYWTQFSLELNGPLAIERFQEAWRAVVAEQAALRSVFSWEKRERPLQVVRRTADLPWTQHDWSADTPAVQTRRLEDYLAQDRAKSRDLLKGPLQSLALIKLGESRHRFVWGNHHLILDGWSVFLVLNRVLDTYDHLLQGKAAPAAPGIRFRSYIDWLSKQSMADAEKLFRQYLAGVTTPTPLVVDTPTSREPSGEAKFPVERQSIPANETAQLVAFARAQRVTLNTVMQAAWGLLLHRYCGEADVIFGVTFSGRSAPVEGIEGIVGLLINTLPVRLRFDPAQTVGAWLEQVQKDQADLLQFQHAPLVQVQGWSDIPRGQPMFESLFIFDNYPVRTGWMDRPGGLAVRDVRSVERTNYPLTVMAGVQTTTELSIQYDARRFSGESVRRMLGHFQQLLAGIVANPACRIGELPLLTPAEHRQIVLTWNETVVPYSREACVHQLFEAQAQQSPERIAVAFEQQQLTYRELNARAGTVAAQLRARGVGPEVLVGIHIERSIEMLVAVLGILKAGGAYVPLDPAFPKDRIGMMIEDAAMPVILTQTKLLAAMPETTAQKLCIDTIDFASASPVAASGDGAKPNPENLAYVLFTSGSTGRPKGVQIPHTAVVNFLESMKHTPGLKPDDTLLAITTLSFDIAGLELLLPLVCGAKVVIASRSIVVDGPKLAALMHDTRTTVLQATPATWRMLIEAGWNGDPRLKILCGGEALNRDLANSLLSRCGELWNMYGPTETTIWSTCCRISAGDPAINIGRPIDNTEIYIVDAQLQPVPVGVAGQLLIGGAGLARGYLKRPELTSEKFIAHPFKTGARLYCTGDLARYQETGTITCLGRTDHQVKLRGFRIELGEIESALARHPEITQCVVVAQDNALNGEKRLVAYLVPRSKPAPASDVLIQHLRRQLPDYMVPATFVVLDRLPLTPNGKVDRKALPKPDQSESAGLKNLQPPRTPRETNLVEIWRTVLGVERIGIHESFFSLGGHSLLALKVISRIRQQLNIEAPISALFEAPSVAEMALKLSEIEAEKLGADELAGLLAEIEGSPATGSPSPAGPTPAQS